MAVIRHGGNQSAAAESLGIARGTVSSALTKIKRFAAQHGVTQWGAPAENLEGFRTCKTTVQYDAAGNIKNEWRRQVPELEDLETVVDELCERVEPVKRIKPQKGRQQLCLEIPIGDLHMGMYAWSRESGADYDCDIAAHLLTRAVSLIVSRSPKCKRIVLANLGDYFHSDNRAGTTERSGNVLDMDGRLTRVIDAGIDAMAAAVEICAASCEQLTLINLPGNHDPVSAHWIARVMAQRYRKSDHIEVRTDPRKRHYYQHGSTLLGYTHGDRVKAADLVSLMAAEQPREWADTQYRAYRCGHVHHARRHRQNDTAEYQGTQVEYFGVLAGKDAWHHEGGYTSRRYLQGIVHDAVYGEQQRITVTADECRHG